MEVFQTLKIFVPDTILSEFQDNLFKQVAAEGWTHKNDFERDYRVNTMSNDIVICIESAPLLLLNKELKAFIWIRNSKNAFEVFNIIPITIRSLSYEQYNFILGEFYNKIVKKVALNLQLDTVITSPQKSMRDIIGDDAFDLLYKFSKSANKTTGNTNPFDFNRWCDFVFAIFRNKTPLNIDEFVRWLEEDERWSNDIAWKLGLDLEYALGILEKYEHHN